MKIKASYDVDEVYEISVNACGHNFLIIYGHHINGWFISILNWNVCTEASNPNDVYYNASKLEEILKYPDPKAHYLLADAICKHFNVMRLM